MPPNPLSASPPLARGPCAPRSRVASCLTNRLARLVSNRASDLVPGRVPGLVASAAALACALGLGAAPTPAAAQETFKLGVVSFLSGQAAESFGIPAVNGGKWLIDYITPI